MEGRPQHYDAVFPSPFLCVYKDAYFHSARTKKEVAVNLLESLTRHVPMLSNGRPFLSVSSGYWICAAFYDVDIDNVPACAGTYEVGDQTYDDHKTQKDRCNGQNFLHGRTCTG